ncbi:hypothetical protein [Rhizobium mongolense]|uniref:hypothetical protein n=1 Tax=Rhizobium mongolense TaxID=57676 RepID=UPI0034A5BAAB
MLRDQALAEEHSIQNLTAACGGEIDAYLKERQNAGIKQESEKDLHPTMRFGERVKSVNHRLSAFLPMFARFNRGTQPDLLFIVQSQGFQMGRLGYSCLQLGSNDDRRNAVRFLRYRGRPSGGVFHRAHSRCAVV